MARKKADKPTPKEAGRAPLTARAGRLLGRSLHALRPAWVLAVAGVAYLGLVFVLESAAAAHPATRIQKVELQVQPPPALPSPGAPSTTASAEQVEYGCQQTDRRLQRLLTQSLGKNPRQDALVNDIRSLLKNDAGLRSLDEISPLFPGKIRVVVTSRVPECRIAATGRAIDADGVLLPVDMGHRPLPDYSRDTDPQGKAANGRLVDPLYPQAIQAMRTISTALPELANKPALTIQSIHIKDAGQPAELIVTLKNGARLEWGRLNEAGEYAAQLAQRRNALLAVQARYADLNNLLVVRLFDVDAPVVLRDQPVEFRPGAAAWPAPVTLSTTRSAGH